MISVLIPTRKRVRMLDRLLHSIWDMSSSEEAVQILLRCDEDDQETIAYLEGIKSQNHNLQVLVGPRKDGYKSSPSFFNEMAAVAKGNLLMSCNDDVIFRTKGWDRIVEDVAAHYPDGIFDIGVNSILNPQAFVFPIVSRRWVDIVGYLHDTRLLFQGKFFKDISDAFGRSIYIPEVIVEHDYAGWHDDATFAEARKWAFEIVGDASSKRRREYKRLHDQAVAEAIEKLKPHLDPSIKSTAPVRALCIRFEKIKPIVNLRYVDVVPGMDNRPQLFGYVGFYPRMLEWLDSKPLLKSVLIRMGVRFIVGKLLNLIHRRRTQER